MALAFKYVLICDDIRREDSGKFLVIGLYTPNIIAAKLPIHLRGLAFLLGLEADGPGKHRIGLKLTHLESGTEIAKIDGETTIAAAGFAALSVVIPPIKFDEAGPYALSIEIDGAEPQAYTFSVVEQKK